LDGLDQQTPAQDLSSMKPSLAGTARDARLRTTPPSSTLMCGVVSRGVQAVCCVSEVYADLDPFNQAEFMEASFA
jgi:hypothetical protein